jgi:hypothetical protein
LSIDPNPEKRLTPLKTMEKFENLFDNSVNWEEVANNFY